MAPIGSHVKENEKKKKNRKNLKIKILKKEKKLSGDMTDRYLSKNNCAESMQQFLRNLN